jgi:dTDP-4-amino-4,6-dideoxygalactose transaminase
VTAIPFFGTQREWEAHGARLRPVVEAALASGRWLQGEPVAAFERALAARCERAHAVTVGSGTDALFFVLLALGIGRGDEVIVPDLSFVATAAAVVRAGARPVWADVDEHGVLDLDAAAGAVGRSTAAVVAVSLYGRPLNPSACEGFAARHGLALVEDAAQALGASHGGRPAGAVGRAGCMSFDPTKPLAAPGSGGAVLTDDDALAQACRSLRLHGRDPDGRFAQLGYNSQLPTLAAAALEVKLALEPAWRARRRTIAAAYNAALAGTDGLALPTDPTGGEHAYSKYVVRLSHRDRLRATLAQAQIPALVHYPQPLSTHPLFASCDAADAPCARELTRSVLTLPLHPFLTDDEVARVAAVTANATAAPHHQRQDRSKRDL